MMSQPTHDAHAPHGESETEAANGLGTVHHSPRGETLRHPILDGSTEHYDEDVDPRFGMDNPELIRHTSTGEETPTPNEEA
ncbi:hypothetical protein G7066_06335 [Leucobacter coleopterorum]|uniref:Uncharacterized protein n=1 Tax=Leucobacter coleopterorum TaxID=2714933 RepID=A0ABX6JVS5_9MICO|nr:hypothetical protein [Leucobacter coleopterorum]QIM18362.1 hypothetical protein G7066_06335 [Leucobacter coleopterorum]